MKLDFLSFDYDKFASEMQNLKEKKPISLRIQRPMSVALLR